MKADQRVTEFRNKFQELLDTYSIEIDHFENVKDNDVYAWIGFGSQDIHPDGMKHSTADSLMLKKSQKDYVKQDSVLEDF